MKLISYQSEIVLNTLLKGEIHLAKPSISFSREYMALIDMLDLHCKCPIFAVVHGKKQNSSGRVSSSVKLILEVPEDKIKFTEFSVWADFLYSIKFAKPHDYSKVLANYHDLASQKHENLIKQIKNQQSLDKYDYPQAILEYIDPKWLVSYKMQNRTNKQITTIEKIGNFFK